MNTFYNNPEKSSTSKINKHTPSGYSLFTHCSFDVTKNKLSYYKGKDCMKKFSKNLKEHVKEIIDCKKKKWYHWQKRKINYVEIKKLVTYEIVLMIKKVRDHCYFTGKYRGAAHDVCNLNYKAPKEIPIVFHNGSTYHYHLIIKELAKEFKGKFKCLGENTEKHITFSVPIKNDKGKKYKVNFIDSFRFMSSSISSLVDNLSDGLYNDKCIDSKSYLDYMLIKNHKLIFRCFKCKKNIRKISIKI